MMNVLRTYVRLLIEHIRSVRDERFNFQKFRNMSSLDDMVRYVTTHLKQVGAGSSRRVFIFSGNKVIKLARNHAGLGQNREELNVFTNPKTAAIVARIFDYDPDFFWILSETARPITEVEFEEIVGLDQTKTDRSVFGKNQLYMRDFCRYAAVGDFRSITWWTGNARVMKFAVAIHTLVKENDLIPGDIIKLDSWGKTADGRLIVVDYGYSEDVAWKHY